MTDSLAALGIPVELAGSFEDDTCEIEIYPQNWKTVHLFASVGTQWRAGMGGAYGLDYSAVAVVARSMGIKLTDARMQGIQVMEAEALKIMGEKRER